MLETIYELVRGIIMMMIIGVIIVICTTDTTPKTPKELFKEQKEAEAEARIAANKLLPQYHMFGKMTSRIERIDGHDVYSEPKIIENQP